MCKPIRSLCLRMNVVINVIINVVINVVVYVENLLQLIELIN